MRAKINWGMPVYVFLFMVMLLNLAFFYNIVVYFHPLIFLFFIPVLVLDIIMFPVFRSLFAKRYDLIISVKGIEINGKLHLWETIKSISFQTGRLVTDYDFMRGLKLPAKQKIFILDNEGNEYYAVIDIDYLLKSNRFKNNLIIAKEELSDMGKTHILSDWAEKR